MRLHQNGLKFLSIAAAMFFLAACGTTPADMGPVEEAPPPPPVEAAPPEPAGPAPGSADDLVINVGDRVFFALDQHDLDGKARATLERQAAWLKKYPSTTIVVEGHCDERGTREYNLALGDRRANSAKNYLVALGVNESRVSTISYGKERPVALGSNDDAWAQNRRGVTRIR